MIDDRIDSSRRPDQGQPRPGSARGFGRWFFVRRGLALVAPADVHRAGKTGDVRRPLRPRACGSRQTRFAVLPAELALISMVPKLIVADAFGGQLAVVDTRRRTIESVRSLPAHNIRGLAFAPDGRTLVVAHQVLNRLAQTSFDDVHWGLLIRNHLRVLQIVALADARLRRGAARWRVSCSTWAMSAMAAGDPGDVAFDARGNLFVALAGVDEVAITASPDQGPRRIVVGRRPAAVLPSPDGCIGVCRRQSRRHDLGRRDRDRTAPGDDLAGAPAGTDRGRPRRAAVFECQAVARWLDELS